MIKKNIFLLCKCFLEIGSIFLFVYLKPVRLYFELLVFSYRNLLEIIKHKIMKNTILIFAISLLMINCSKNDDAPIPNPNVTEENFLSGYLTATGFNEYISEDIGLAVGVESTLELDRKSVV